MNDCRGLDGDVNRIFLWMSPRSLSTAITKCVGLMDGNCVWFEPYTTCMYLDMFENRQLRERYPRIAHLQSLAVETTKNLEAGNDNFKNGNLKSLTTFSYDWVQQELSKPLPTGKTFLFVKDLALSITDRFDKLPKVHFKHTFLIRDPLRTAGSTRKLSMAMFGCDGNPEDFNMHESNPFFDPKGQPLNPCHSLWKYVKDNIDPTPVVIDADDLQNFPEQMLKKYCEAVEIPFEAKYLHWEEGDESIRYYNGCIEQIVLGKQLQIFKAAFTSSHFEPIKSAKPKFEDLTPDCQRFVLENQDGYKEMFESRIKPEIKLE